MLLSTESLQHLPAALLPRLIGLFETSSPAMIAEIRLSAAKEDWQTMAKAAHKLKGSCVSLGAVMMADRCKQLQEQGEAGLAVEALALIDELERLYPMTLALLQAYRSA